MRRNHEKSFFCLNGHYIEDHWEKKFDIDDNEIENHIKCPICGEKGISRCQECDAHIVPYRHDEWSRIPNYCMSCGTQHSWSVKNEESIMEMIDFDKKISNANKKEIKRLMPKILKEEPNYTYAISRVNEILTTSDSNIAKELLGFIWASAKNPVVQAKIAQILSEMNLA